MKSSLDNYQVYNADQIGELVALYLAGADRDRLDPILDACVAIYIDTLNEDGQVDFKGKAKAFVRTYGFLASVLPSGNPVWEKLSIFLNFLIPKLPAPKETDLSKGILEGDWLVLPLKLKSAIAVGEIKSKFTYDPNAEPPFQSWRDVHWLAKDVPRSAFD